MFPHAFVIFGIAMLTALQLLSLDILSFRQKRYFEDLFFLGSPRPPPSPAPPEQPTEP